MATLIDLVVEVFETDDLSRVAAGVESGDIAFSTLNDLYVGWGEWASQVELPASPGRSMPYALAAWGGHGADGLAAAWPRLIGSERQRLVLQRQLFKHLLLCDAVALPDPFITAEAPGARPLPRVEGLVIDEAAVRIWVARVLRNLDHYADLIRHDVIVIVPRPDWIDTREIVDLDRAIGNDLREAFPEQQVDHWGVSHAAQAAAALVTQMRTAERYPALDPYFPTQGYWRVSERLHALARDDTCGTSTQAALLTEFLRLEIAQPRELSMRDIVRIRHDGQFDRFRASIATGIVRYLTLAQAAGGAPLLAQPAADLKREIATSVREEATLAERDLGWLKRPETTTTVELLLIAGAAASAFTEPATAAGLASSAAIPVVAEAFLRWRRANSALARHVSVFR